MVLATIKRFLEGRKRALSQGFNPYFKPSTLSVQSSDINGTSPGGIKTQCSQCSDVPAKKRRLDRPKQKVRPQKNHTPKVRARSEASCTVNNSLTETGQDDKDKLSKVTTSPNSSNDDYDKRKQYRRKSIQFRVGEKIEALDKGDKWYPSRITNVDLEGKKIYVHYQGWNSKYDSWVSMDSSRIRPALDTKNENLATEGSFKVGESVLAKWTDCKMYPAKVLAKNEDGSYEVIYYDGVKKSLLPVHLKVMPPILPVLVKPLPAGKEEEILNKRYKAGEIVLAKWTDCKMYPAKILKVNDNSSYEVLYYDGVQKTLLPIHLQEINIDTKASGNCSMVKQVTNQDVKSKMEVDDKGDVQATNSNDGDSKSETSLPLDANGESSIKQENKTEEPILQKGNDIPQEKTKITDTQATNHSQANGYNDVSVSLDPMNPRLLAAFSLGVLGTNTLLKKPAPKEFIVEEDHNRHKCTVENCGKTFRKEILLQSHLKHYHNIKSHNHDSSLDESLNEKQNDLTSPVVEKKHKTLSKSPTEEHFGKLNNSVNQTDEQNKGNNTPPSEKSKTEPEIADKRKDIIAEAIKRKAEAVDSIGSSPTKPKDQANSPVKRKPEIHSNKSPNKSIPEIEQILDGNNKTSSNENRPKRIGSGEKNKEDQSSFY